MEFEVIFGISKGLSDEFFVDDDFLKGFRLFGNCIGIGNLSADRPNSSLEKNLKKLGYLKVPDSTFHGVVLNNILNFFVFELNNVIVNAVVLDLLRHQVLLGNLQLLLD